MKNSGKTLKIGIKLKKKEKSTLRRCLRLNLEPYTLIADKLLGLNVNNLHFNGCS